MMSIILLAVGCWLLAGSVLKIAFGNFKLAKGALGIFCVGVCGIKSKSAKSCIMLNNISQQNKIVRFFTKKFTFFLNKESLTFFLIN